MLDSLSEDGDRLGKVQSLVRAFGLLDSLAKHDDGLTLSEVARLNGLPKSTAHRLLTTMDALRYVAFEASSSRWMVGPQAFALGAAFVQTRDIGRLGRPIMSSLMLESDEVVNIAVDDANGVRYVGQVRPHVSRREAGPSGVTMPVHTTASGKVMLAYWPEAERDAFLSTHALARRTRSTIVDKDALVRHLEVIRRRGYAIDDQENRSGTRCVAAPVFDSRRRVRASLSISGGVTRLPEPRLEALGASLAAAARRMTEHMGNVLAA